MHEDTSNSGMFRFSSDVIFDDSPPSPGHVSMIRLKPFADTCSLVQFMQPLNEAQSSFFVQIHSMGANSVVSFGVAGPDVSVDVHPLDWNRSVGLQSNGRCKSSHYSPPGSNLQPFGVGDLLGLRITHFDEMSSVVFLKNGKPVATRYLNESDVTRYLPCVGLENGPIELGVVWPPAVICPPDIPQWILSSWIRPADVQLTGNQFISDASEDLDKEIVIKSPVPLTHEMQHIEVVVLENSETGAGPSLAVVSCSTIFPAQNLLNDFFKWTVDGEKVRCRVGQRLGIGIHYDPGLRDAEDFDPLGLQPVVVFVTVDVEIVVARMIIQPPGGWYPCVLLNNNARRVEVDVESNPVVLVTDSLDQFFMTQRPQIEQRITNEFNLSQIADEEIRHSSPILYEIKEQYIEITLPAQSTGSNVFQLLCPLTKDNDYFCVEIVSMGDLSVIAIGVAGGSIPETSELGRVSDSVSYGSRKGAMLYNCREAANTQGRPYQAGDLIGVQVVHFGDEKPSVVQFSKNTFPVGTRYLTEEPTQFFRSLSLSANGADVTVRMYPQTRLRGSPNISFVDAKFWCLPEGAWVEDDDVTVHVHPCHLRTEAIQGPLPLGLSDYNHFEIELLELDNNAPCPIIALTTASPFHQMVRSNFEMDFVRYVVSREARSVLRVGDLIGWGLLPCEDDLVLCYLTLNRDVVLTRVLKAPPGGFYPLVLLPTGVNTVRLNFTAVRVVDHPFTADALSDLLSFAKQLMTEEMKQLETGQQIEDCNLPENICKYMRPIPPLVLDKNSELQDDGDEQDSAMLSEEFLISKDLKVLKKSKASKRGSLDGKIKKEYERIKQDANMESRSCVVM